MTRDRLTSFLVVSLLVSLAACGGAGPYGYAQEYVPLGDEEPHLERAEEVPYESVRRDPAEYKDTTLEWFGVVTTVAPADGGRIRVSMEHVAHRDRHLCSDATDSSCRVTVSEKRGGIFSTTLPLTPEERAGESRVWTGSLMRIYGHPTGEFDDQGGLVIAADYYRHWPRKHYVTTGAARVMRR